MTPSPPDSSPEYRRRRHRRREQPPAARRYGEHRHRPRHVTVSPSAENLDTIQGAVTVVASGSTTVDDRRPEQQRCRHDLHGDRSAVMRSGSATITHDVMPVILNTRSGDLTVAVESTAGVRR